MSSVHRRRCDQDHNSIATTVPSPAGYPGIFGSIWEGSQERFCELVRVRVKNIYVSAMSSVHRIKTEGICIPPAINNTAGIHTVLTMDRYTRVPRFSWTTT